MPVASSLQKLMRAGTRLDARIILMAYRIPPFRPSFPMLLASGLLLVQPMTSMATGQVNCRADGAGWVCSPLESTPALPPRPQRSAPAPAAPEPRTSDAPRQNMAIAQTRSVDNRFSELDWVPREQLSEAQQAAIAPYCRGAYVEPPRVGRDDETPFEDLPIYAVADASRYSQETQRGTLSGDVLLRQGRLQAQAEQAHFDRNENLVTLQDQVRLRDQGVLMLGDSAGLQIDSGRTQVNDVTYVVHESHARGTADKVVRREDAIIVMTNGTYTTCEPGENTWTLRAKDIELDREQGWGEAKHVRLHVKDVPVFYTPYITFPLDDRRKSGLLPPSFSTSTRSGTEVTVPYYFNLAPNYDATLYPRFMSKRGALVEGEARHLGHTSRSQLDAAFLDDSEFGDQRWMYRVRHDQQLAPRLSAHLDAGDISDPFYFQDLNTALDGRPDTYVDQRGALHYTGNGWRFHALVHSYELATVTAVSPYERLPQLQLDGGTRIADTGLRLDYSTQYTYFDRDLQTGVITGKNGAQIDGIGLNIPKPDENLRGLQRATGHRVNVSPALSYPMRTSWGFLTPTARVESTHYDLEIDSRADGFDYAAVDTRPSTTLPVASLDGGLYFDRDTTWFGNSMRQTLEPRAFYLYAPYRDQNDQPLFDTYETTFSYASLYRDDRFSGRDRTGDANQLTLGATTRLLDDRGRERIRGSLGQIFYFDDRRVQLDPLISEAPPRDRQSRSAYAAEFMYQMHDHWRLSSNILWDPQESDGNAGDVRLNYQPEPRKVVNLGYRFRNELNTFDALTGTFNRDPNRRIDQSDISFIWPLGAQWSVIGRYQHDFADDRTLEAFGGLEYDSCCWKVRFINRYWVDYDEFESVASDRGNRGIFLQIVLKGLGNVTGNRVESLLDEGIPGYRERETHAF